MTAWQRRARLIIGVSAVAFAIFVAFQFKRREPPPPAAPAVQTDAGVVAETIGGRIEHFELSHENAEIRYAKQQTFSDGSSKFFDATILAQEKNNEGSFTATAKDATLSKDQTAIVLNGDVRLTSSTTHARTEHATYTKGDNTIRAPGPVDVTEGKTTASGIGMIFDRERDVLTILDQAVVRTADEDGAGATEITCATAVFDRRARNRRFEKNVRMQRGGRLLEAETVVATLSEDEKRVETVELRENGRISTAEAAVGALQSLSGRNATLKYAANGESLEHAVIDQDAVIQLAGERRKPGRQIVARIMDITLAPDGSPIALIARENVQLTLPAEPDVPSRTIRAASLDAKGEPARGLSRAQFSGSVQYREVGIGAGRAAAAETLDVGLKPGLSTIEDARFARGVRFEEGKLVAQAAAARYDLDKGTLELSGSEPAMPTPHVVTERITVDAQKIDVVLDGPKVKATTNVKSVLQPGKKGQKPGEGDAVKLPSMLKQDAPVNVLGTALEYDGTKSVAVYTGDARLFQGETSVKADSIAIDSKSGGLVASGNVTSATLLQQTANTKEDKKKPDAPKERVRSIASATDLRYDDDDRRLTYSGGAHLSNRDGDMQAEKIELYLKPSGDELDRAEAFDALTLKEQNRKTTGARMTYTADSEQYIISGAPVKIVDECGRETIGKTLTFLKATDRIVVDGNQQIRTLTKSGGKCSS
jgi:LPS export ABC transporter protein LptC